MREAITLWQCLSLAGCKHRISPDNHGKTFSETGCSNIFTLRSSSANILLCTHVRSLRQSQLASSTQFIMVHQLNGVISHSIHTVPTDCDGSKPRACQGLYQDQIQCSTLTLAWYPILWKILLGFGILKSCSPHGYWNFSVFSIVLKYMAPTNFNRAVDLKIQIDQSAVLKDM